MKTPYLSAALFMTLAIGLGSCQRSTKDNNAKSGSDASGASTTVAADSGKSAKWAMPEAMMSHMRLLEQDVLAFESSDEKDHAALAAKIDGHTKQVISSCTMEGKAHDALHGWLMPFLQLNKDYASAPDDATRAAKLKEIRESLEVFHERFE